MSNESHLKRRKILFVTATRADFGKLSPLLQSVEKEAELHLFVTGMHLIQEFGHTLDAVRRFGFENLHIFENQTCDDPTEVVLSKTIRIASDLLRELRPDLTVVHGDRVEAMGVALAASFGNFRLAHIEGGELSGSIDGTLRHGISKLSHLHFVSNTESADRLIRMGERPESVFAIGSPETDVLMSESALSLPEVKARVGVSMDRFGILLFHSVPTERERIESQVRAVVEAVLSSQHPFVVLSPNNDEGSRTIQNAYKEFEGQTGIQIFPSLEFEDFVSLLKGADFLLGNSSCGVREAPACGIPSIDIGSRQAGRAKASSVIHVEPKREAIEWAIRKAREKEKTAPRFFFGKGGVAREFLHILNREETWQVGPEKIFYD